MKPAYQFFATHPTLYAVAEFVYWGIIIALVLFMFWRSGRSEAAAHYRRGQNDGRKFIVDGVSTVEIEGFLRVQRDGGRYGPYEAGMASILKGDAK